MRGRAARDPRMRASSYGTRLGLGSALEFPKVARSRLVVAASADRKVFPSPPAPLPRGGGSRKRLFGPSPSPFGRGVGVRGNSLKSVPHQADRRSNRAGGRTRAPVAPDR